MVTRYSRNGVTWVDLEAPSPDELRAVMKEFAIDARVEEEIVTPTPYPLVLSCPRYVYLILHFPTANPKGGARNQEIDFVVGKDFVVTVRYEVVDSIHSLHRVFETEALLGTSAHHGAGHIVERVLRHIYGAIREQAELASRKMEGIEENIFAGRERAMVREISHVARILLRFDTALSRHEEPLKAFLEDLAKPPFFGKAFAVHAAHIQAEHDHTAAIVGSYRAVIRELRITNDSLLTSSQNEVIKTLTVMAFLAFPLTLMASIFGMNTEHTPIVGAAADFWIIIGLMLLAVLGIFMYFKSKRWI